MAHLSQCKCDRIIANLSTHLFQCPYKSEHTTDHNTFCCNYCFKEWNKCSKGGFPPFPSSHPTSNGYPYHQKQLVDFGGHCHCLPDSHKYETTNIDDNNACSDDDYSRKDTIIHWANTKQWLHSPCYWDISVSSFLFWFIFYHLCTYHYRTLSEVFFNPLNACFLLSTTRVHNLATCTSHNDPLMNFCTW